MNILYRAYFHTKISRRNLPENLLRRFQKSDPDPVKNRPNPKHCFVLEAGTSMLCRGKKVPEVKNYHAPINNER
jgi:hypothetical protein